MSNRIIPHLWFDKEAMEASEFYVNAIGNNSKILSSTVLKDTPSGDAETVNFELLGQEFMAISAGPYFKINPSISFFVNFDPSKDESAKEKLSYLWEKLSEGGSVLMDLGEYPFSPYYGWVQDKYGLSWQLILTNPKGEERPNIIPSLLFTGDKCGQAEEAIDFYVDVFKNSKKGSVSTYAEGQAPNKNARIAYGDFMVENYWMVAMDSGVENDHPFSEALSFIVKCDDQKEIDYYWERLSAVPEAEQCGWLKDKFGVSWQIVPKVMEEILGTTDEEKVQRVTQVFLKMKKIDIEKLLAA